jgi:hypothetical protein
MKIVNLKIRPPQIEIPFISLSNYQFVERTKLNFFIQSIFRPLFRP